MKRYRLVIVPLLLTLGPFWMVSFSGGGWTLLRLAGIAGAIGLSLGLIQLLSKVYYLQQRIEWLEGVRADNLSHTESRADAREPRFEGKG